MMKSRLALTKRRRLFLIGVVICAMVISGLIVWGQTRPAAQAAVVNSHPGLVGWWRFDEGSGTVAGDSSGSGNNGTVYGATRVNGEYGDALSFNGTSYVGSIGSASFWQSLGGKTIVAWIYPTSFGSQMQILGNRNDSNSPPVGFGFGLTSSGNLMTWTYPWTDVVSVLKPTLNAWNFVAMTHNGTTITFYLNSQSDPKTNVQPPSLGGGVLAIGQGGGAYPYERFIGVIDEVRIYNQALSAADIGSLFQNAPDFSSKLLASIPKGTTQVVATLSWQGTGSINVTIQSPSQNYTEDIVPEYQKTEYSTSGGTSSMLNIKRLSISITALSSDQNWYIVLQFDNVNAYQVSVEVQK